MSAHVVPDTSVIIKWFRQGEILAAAESLGCELWTANQRLHNAVDLPWVRLVAAPS